MCVVLFIVHASTRECAVLTVSGAQNKFGNEAVARASFVQLFRALQPEGAKHPMARHLLRQIERESCRQSGEPDGSGCIGFEQFMEVRKPRLPALFSYPTGTRVLQRLSLLPRPTPIGRLWVCFPNICGVRSYSFKCLSVKPLLVPTN